jgi:apolipoprotein N-acyltransferase
MAACGGGLLALAFAPFNAMLLSLVAIVPLLWSLESTNGKQAFVRGYVFGLVFGLINLIWLQQFVAKWTNSWWMGAIPWLVVCVLFAVYFGLFAIGAAKAWAKGWYWAIPLVWAGVEFSRSIVPYIYFPWSQLGTSLYKLPILLQPAWWSGIYFLGAFIVLFNVSVALLFAKLEVKRFRPYLLSTLLVIGGSIVSYSYDPPANTKWLVAAQPGVDLAFGDEIARSVELAKKVPEVMRLGGATKRDLIVLPEHLADGSDGNAPVGPFEWVYEIPFVVGVQRNTPEGSYQSLYGWDGEWKYADKLRLVIFGEYVPFRERLEWYVKSFDLPPGDMRFADKITTLEVAGLKVGGLVCFEGLFEEVARKHASNGAHLLALSSMDDWYQGTNAIEALKAGAVLRAVENRLPLVKSSPLGPSFVVDWRGNIQSITRVGRTEIARAEVKIGPSFVSPLRHVFPWICLAVWAVSLFWPKRTAALKARN